MEKVARAAARASKATGAPISCHTLATDELGTPLMEIDPCSDARYDFNGVALHDGATSDLHRFEVRREETGYVVSFEELILGACRNGATEDCSPAGEELRIPVPKGTLPSSFGE